MTESAAIGNARAIERIRTGVCKRANWEQLLRFATVGASGYVVNLTTFAVVFSLAGVGYLTAAIVAFLVAVTNNFFWNRAWTFRSQRGWASFRPERFLVVSGVALLVNLVLLRAFVEGLAFPELPSQALAICCATPLNFIGNKLWSFR